MASRTLVAFYTKGGATETYAKVIVETLAKNGIQADLVNLREKIPDVAAYDNIIVGTGIRMSMVYRRWRKVLKQKPLKDRRLFMFLSSGTAIKDPHKAVDQYLKPIIDKFDLKPLSLGSFPGMTPEKWAKTEAEKNTVRPETASAWAQEIADRLKNGPA